ncbi:hypothetical protein [Dyadobacter pollutisoli]|jgi:hypothetical protein|nr:hypothetical protein [Dyadobacter pollutisoli]
MIILSLLLTAGRCDPPEGWDAGGPIEMYLHGMWKLIKVVTPTDTLIGSQIGYNEILNNTYKDGIGYDSTFRNDTVFAVHIRLKNPLPVSKTKDMTILMYYRGGLQRFHKIIRTNYITTLETSDYLKEVGTDADSVKYIYGRF